MRIDDLIITVAYFSIPLQLLGSLSMYPRLASMPPKVVTLCLLFCFFIFLCGAGHLMRCLNLTHTTGFLYLNSATAIVSLITAIYLLPLVPSLMGQLDQSLQDLVNLNHETNESKKKLFTFMAFLCHEIRNPLFAITSSVDCLLATTTTTSQDATTTTTSCLTKEQQIAVGSIMDSSHLMLRLANDVLDLSKIDAGKLILEETTFHLHRLLERLAHSMETQVRQRQQFVTWSFHLDKEMVPKQILGDSVRILQIVYNLCSNAIKFTSKGRVELKISICTPEQAQRVGLHSFYNNYNNSLQQEEAAKQSSPKTTTKTTNSTRNTNNNNNYYNDSFGTSFIVDGTTEEDESNAFSMSLLDSMENGCDYGGCSNNNTTSSGNHYYQSVATTEQNQPENNHHDESNNNTDQRVLLQIEVSDTGSGIPSERLPSIFEPYSQSKLSDYRKHGGTGLGLSIISGLVKAMEGKITVQSTLHKGSTFLVYLPMKVAPDDEDEDASDDEDDEDDDMIRTTTPLLLHETGSGLNHQQEQEEQHPLLQQQQEHHQQQQTNGGSNRVLPVILSSRRLPLLENTEHFLLKRCGSETTLNDLGHVSITTASHLLPLPSSPTRSRSLGAKINGRGTNRDDEQTRSVATSLVTTMTADSLQKGVSMASSTSSSLLPSSPPSGGQQQQPSHVPPSTLFPENTTTTTTLSSPSNMMPPQRQSSSSLSTTKKKKKKKTKNNQLLTMKPFSFKEPNKKIVLVVDDNQMNLKILGRMLHNFHLLYHTAENGKEALNLILKQQKEEEQYALILMDICMPIMDGYEAIQEIRKQQQNNIGIPIIALTANALSTERERAIQVGANGFHTKPILRKDLYALCKQYLGEDDEEENYESNNNNDRGRSSIMKNKNGNRDDHVVNGDGHKKKNGNSPDYMEASTSDVSAVMPTAVV